MSKPLNIGIIGCGNISSAYLKACKLFQALRVVAVSDLNMELARSRAAEFEVPKALEVSELLADPEVDIVINLTIPSAHADISIAALNAGKSVYSEKPLATTRADGQRLIDAAKKSGKLLGCAPDTFLGGGIQTCRKLIDDGWIGKPFSATAFMVNHGMEMWHPNPDFFFQAGAGPLFDVGVYYVTALVNLLGPVAKVSALASTTFPERTITSQPRFGEKIKVTTPTHIMGLLQFENGSSATLISSNDVWGSELPRVEIYGTEGSLSVPDPNTFGGPVKLKREGAKDWTEVPLTHQYTDNSRGLGAADLATALGSGRKVRASGEFAFHVLDVMETLLEASEKQSWLEVKSTCERPAPFPLGMTMGILDS